MGKLYTYRVSASSQRGIVNMDAGKLFVALPIAFFWVFIRHLKRESGFWANNLSINLKPVKKKAEVVKQI